MLVNLRDIMAIAEQRNMAIGAFDTPSLEGLRAVIDAAEQTGLPVIISQAQCHEDITPLDVIGPIMVSMAERSSATICVHLDHCEDLDYMRRALEMGFSGAMYDGSLLPYEVNVANSARAVDMCASFDAGVECELGSMGAREGGGDAAKAIYTDPSMAAEFIASTGIDALACSFGTVHGLYKAEPKLNFDIVRGVREQNMIPIVMHGGSGVSDEDYAHAIDAGVRKINYYTYGVKAGGEAAAKVVAEKNGGPVYWHDLTPVAYEAMLQDTIRAMKVFANGSL